MLSPLESTLALQRWNFHHLKNFTPDTIFFIHLTVFLQTTCSVRARMVFYLCLQIGTEPLASRKSL